MADRVQALGMGWHPHHGMSKDPNLIASPRALNPKPFIRFVPVAGAETVYHLVNIDGGKSS